VLDAIRQIKRSLSGRVPLLGFAGAPFTLASYAIEGGHSNTFAHTKAVMYGHPKAWHTFCDLLADVVGDYLVAQIDAGADAVQVFDSWVGALNAADYREFILPHTKKIFDRVAGSGVPTIHSAWAPGRSLASCARRRRRHRRRLAHTARRSVGAHRRRSRHPRQPRPYAAAWSARPRVRRHRRNPRPRRPPVLATSSTRPRYPSTTPVEHVQALARYVHQENPCLKLAYC